MKNNLNIVIIVIGIIASIAWVAMTYDESGWGPGNFAGLVMIFGMIVLPSILDIRKKKKHKNTK